MKRDKNYKERYGEVCKKKYMKKILFIKNALKNLFDIEDKEISHVLSMCAHYHHKSRDDLTEQGRLIYDWLLKEGFNPGTVYKWFLASLIPEDIKEDLESGRLTQKRALRLSTNIRYIEINHSL